LGFITTKYFRFFKNLPETPWRIPGGRSGWRGFAVHCALDDRSLFIFYHPFPNYSDIPIFVILLVEQALC
jgi:hypothetical protein